MPADGPATDGPANGDLTCSLARTLDAVCAHLKHHIHFVRAEHAAAITLWVAHTHANLDLLEQSPILVLTSAVKQSGKSRLLDLLHHLVRNPWRISRPTEAVLFRKIDRDHPTVLIDEIDTVFGPKAGAAEGIRGLLDSGNRRGTRVPRTVLQGRGFGLIEFDVFCPKATAGIGGLPDTVLDRAVVIPMERRSRGERVERLRERDARELGAPLHDALSGHIVAMERFTVDDAMLPAALDDRAQDSWEPLLAIADAAGGHWPETARTAAVAIFGNQPFADDNVGIRLLADCRVVFDEHAATVLSTFDLRQGLLELDSSPWADIRGREITPHYLAKLLGAFRINSHRARLQGVKNPVAYYARSSFEDAWARYLPASTSRTSDTRGTDLRAEEQSTPAPVRDVRLVPVAGAGSANQATELMNAAWRIFGDDIEDVFVQGTA